MVECTVWWTTPLIDERRYRALLSPAERERYEAFRLDADRRRFLTGRALAKTVTAGRLGVPASKVEFDATCSGCGNQHGAPRLPGTDLVFSIAHSADRVGLALCAELDVGLDVEGTSRRVSDGMLSYALNETELAGVEPLSERDRTAAFFVYWARKEALMKATGQGLRLPLRRITLTHPDGPPQLAETVEATDPVLRPGQVRLADLHAGPGYAAALAVMGATQLTVTEHWWDQTAEPTDSEHTPSPR